MVFDTSVLIFLDILGYAQLLQRLYRVVLPEAVSEELTVRPDLSCMATFSSDVLI